MKKPYFVMLFTQYGYTPMVGDDDELAVYYSKDEADSAAKKSVLGDLFGWETFQIGFGE